MPVARGITNLWLWPWKAAQANVALTETMIGAPAVIAARLPTIMNAMTNPLAADTEELTRMVTEKADAFGLSHRSISAAADKVRTASDANARDLAKLAGGGMLGPTDYMRMTERNLKAWAALVTLPSEALAPVHKRVSGNARRLS